MRAKAQEVRDERHMADRLRTRPSGHPSRCLGIALYVVTSIMLRRHVCVVSWTAKPHRRNMFRRPATLEHPKIPPTRAIWAAHEGHSQREETDRMHEKPLQPNKCICFCAIPFA